MTITKSNIASGWKWRRSETSVDYRKFQTTLVTKVEEEFYYEIIFLTFNEVIHFSVKFLFHA